MISLKKNDKIIVIVAVIIIVIAGVGIAMYQSPKTSSVPPATSGEKNFEITWQEHNATLKMISEFAGKKSPYQGVVTIPDGNLKSITFNLTWTDDHMTMLKRMGLDTLTLEVTTPDGRSFSESNTSAATTGKGMITKTVSVGIIPPNTPIKANDEKAAMAKLMQKPYYDDSWTNKNININVSVHIGELRILKKLRDKGNNFDLKITYQYFEGGLKESKTIPTGQGDDTPPEDAWEPPYMSMIINTGCGRFV